MELPSLRFGKNPIFPAGTGVSSLILAERLVAHLHEALAKDLTCFRRMLGGRVEITHLMSYKHFKIHALVRFRVIENPHNDIHNLGLYSCEKIVSRKLTMLVLFPKLADCYLKVIICIW